MSRYQLIKANICQQDVMDFKVVKSIISNVFRLVCQGELSYYVVSLCDRVFDHDNMCIVVLLLVAVLAIVVLSSISSNSRNSCSSSVGTSNSSSIE